MAQPNDLLQRFLQRLACEQNCELKDAAGLLLKHEWKEIDYRHALYPKIAIALNSSPLDKDSLHQLLVSNPESPVGGHSSTRAHAAAFLKSDRAESLVRMLIGDGDSPPGATTIGEFIKQASSEAFFSKVGGRTKYQHAETALFTSVLLTAVFPEHFVDYRNDRWEWAVKTLGLSELPPRKKMPNGQGIIHAGEVAREIVATEVFRTYLSAEKNGFIPHSDLWTAAGVVYLLCKDKHLKNLAEIPASTPITPTISLSIRKAYAQFKNSREHQFIVALRRRRAEELRALLANPDEINLKVFNREVWPYCSEATIGETDVTKTMDFSTALTEAQLSQLSTALESGKLELHGNCMWGSGSRVYGTKVAGGSEAKLKHLRNALKLLNRPKIDPLEIAGQLEETPGFGPNISTGLCMVQHPADIAIFNEKSIGGLKKLGFDCSGFEEFQRTVRHLRHSLKAEDFIELDWFLFLVSQERLFVSETKAVKEMQLNTILHGPPGTGKTYATMERAVAICDGVVPLDRSELVARYQALRQVNRIVFVTFHQSYGYEEFVEGIRPVLQEAESEQDGADGNVHYECRDGVFKKLCSLAKGTLSVPKQQYEFDPAKIRIWKMSLGDTQNPEDADVFDDCIENGYVLLGYGKGLDFSECNSRNAVKSKLRDHHPDMENTDYNITSVSILRNEMQVGDLVVVSDGNRKFRAIGKVLGDYEFLDWDRYQQKRSVEWLVVYEESLPADTILRKDFSQMSLYQLRPKVLKMDALIELLSEQNDASPENHVLIIDEINRGNISKILGELITLLEPDKRIGGDNELIVKLPYSGAEFGVPSNVYVVGTMNTADRSIAILDTALRRRFRFEEVMPNSDVIRRLVGDGGKIGPVDVGDLLDLLNDRIEVLYDRDHQLGHSFFLQVKSLSDLRDVFRSHVLPLLQEYFYGDWDKVCKVLGCPYDSDTGKLAKKCSSPIILVRALDAEGLEEIDEKRFCYFENPVFVEGGEDELLPFFLSLISRNLATGSGEQGDAV